jgi:hypothetical protein
MGRNGDVGLGGGCKKDGDPGEMGQNQNKIDWMWRACNGERGGDIDESCPPGYILHKKMESIWGFLVYVARTYSTMVPYLKGIHLTLDSWRDGRGLDG